MKKFDNNLLNWLLVTGLDEQRARLYLVSLSKGTASAKELAQELGVSRTAIYDNLENLKEKGYVQVIKEGKKKNYLALHPQELYKKFRAQQEQLKDLLPDFLSIYGQESKAPFVQLFKGKYAAREVYEDILKVAKSEYIYLSPPQLTSQMVEHKYMKEWIKRRIKKGIKSKSLRVRGKDISQVEEYNQEKGYLREIRYLPVNIDLKSTIYVYGNNLGIISTAGEEIAFIIYSPDLAYSFRQILDFLWQVGRKD